MSTLSNARPIARRAGSGMTFCHPVAVGRISHSSSTSWLKVKTTLLNGRQGS
jgi:hypothetical protein